ncbi:hypothetical protein PB2503_09939 [Parvularcula bermudensis HTCC2503]|uniref:Uncharacterized protein n=1 Tax=Parvularcula bermudensis (strain ATCC BAA-594 / HTCC2503 / KCTC 12087) TaxID=314260 RepID=E0TEF4_PARBH|nr:hypothetical protein [Parvularcula bermudensis]ADM10040.1 hypothetical protein PB2503_09939 [Parvularcula bermudensis HTCC2503]
MIRRKKQAIKGQHLPAPALTPTGLRLLLLYGALPIIAGLAVLDGLLYLIFRFGFDRCYGVWCFF